MRAQVDDARARLAETEALLNGGKMDAAAAAIDAQVAHARELGFAPLLAETLLLRGRIFAEQSDAAAGTAAFQEAATVGAAGHDDHLIAAALVEQLALLEDEGGKPADALQWMVAAEAAVARTGDPQLREDFLLARGNTYRTLGRYADARTDLETALAGAEARTGTESRETARIVMSLANVRSDEGDLDEALALDRRAEAIQQKILGPEHPKFAQLLNNIALRLDAAGKYDEARAMFERSMSIKVRTMGAEHPSVAVSLNNLGNVAYHQHRNEEALDYDRRALAIREQALGPEHPLTASTLTNLGLQLQRMGELDEALVMEQRALAIREKVLGPEHPNTAGTLAAMASILVDLRRFDEALVASKRALAIREKALGDHPTTARSYANLSDVLLGLGRRDEACAAAARGLEILEQVVEPDHPALVLPLVARADCLSVRGKAREALPLCERAVAIAEKSDGDEMHLARARRQLAYTLWATGGDRQRAIQLARAAYLKLAGVAGQDQDNVDLTAWLKARHALPDPP
jgi:tetratricopeptide (TPR) repeat protein